MLWARLVCVHSTKKNVRKNSRDHNNVAAVISKEVRNNKVNVLHKTDRDSRDHNNKDLHNKVVGNDHNRVGNNKDLIKDHNNLNKEGDHSKADHNKGHRSREGSQSLHNLV